MKFSKQIKSLDRRFSKLRKKSRYIEQFYNQLCNVNVKNSFRSSNKIKDLSEKAQTSLNKLLEPTAHSINSKELPKIIWMYWDSGFDNAPDVVKLSVKSWIEMNPDYEVRLLSNDNLEHYLGFDFEAMFQLSTARCFPATKADILRLHLLSKYGGVWTDSTTFCLEPLSNWLPKDLEHCGVFNFLHHENSSRPLEAWFIAAPSHNPIINQTLREYVKFIFKERDTTLFISGKLSFLDKVRQNKEGPLDMSVTVPAEELGFMPYFTIAYVFLEAYRTHLSPKQFNIALRKDPEKVMSNRRALTDDDFSIFKEAVISKQTYTQSYIKSDFFKQRKAFLLEKLQLSRQSQ